MRIYDYPLSPAEVQGSSCAGPDRLRVAGRSRKGVAALAAMRVGPGVYTYTYPVPRNFRRPDQSIARGPVCESALLSAGGAVTRADLEKAMATFAKHHQGLRLPVKLDSSWASPNSFSSYFYFFAYYHAAEAAQALGGKPGRRLLDAIRAEILSVAEIDATWVDFPEVGKPYGTAMALLILAMTEKDG